MNGTRVIIIGGGIGGLAAALSLQLNGQRVTVYERAAEFREIGAGLIVWPNARRALDYLGVDAALAALSSCVPVMHGCNYASGAIETAYSNVSFLQQFGSKQLQVHRADLHTVLLDAVRAHDPGCLRSGHEFASLEQDATGVTVRFTNGSTDRADVVIGADGNASAVRSLLLPGEPATFNGQVAYRALIPQQLVPPMVAEVNQAMHRGPKRYLLHYPLRHGSVMNLIGCGQASGWEEEGWAIPATNEEFATAYADFAPHLLELIHAIPEGGLFKWGLRDRKPMENWVIGRVAMLGDAAHPMVPFLGQGACQAVEDGTLLGRAFGVAADPVEALHRYEAARKPRGNKVCLDSHEEGRALQDPSRPRQNALERGFVDYNPATTPV